MGQKEEYGDAGGQVSLIAPSPALLKPDKAKSVS